MARFLSAALAALFYAAIFAALATVVAPLWAVAG